MLRELSLPDGVRGRMFLTGMPGRYRALDMDMKEITEQQISLVISLASRKEIGTKSPDYLEALEADSLGVPVEFFPVPDFGIPDDEPAFFVLINNIADRLSSGDRLAIHCGAGIGRTGTAAACVLLALGLDRTEALSRVRSAGSGPERPAQDGLIERFAGRDA